MSGRGAIIAALGCFAVIVGALALHVLHEVAPAAPPYHPHNASWRYGQHLMESRLYETSWGDEDLTTVCTRALRTLAHPPPHLDLGRAVDGCRYAEWSLDN